MTRNSSTSDNAYTIKRISPITRMRYDELRFLTHYIFNTVFICPLAEG